MFRSFPAAVAVLVSCHLAGPAGIVFLGFPAATRGLGFLRYPASAADLGIFGLIVMLLF